MSLDLALNYPQSQLITSEAKHTSYVCGFGGGKTYGGVVSLLISMFQHPTANFLWLAPTYLLIRDILYPLIAEMLIIMGIDFKINKSENIIHVQGHGLIYCRTMDRPEMIVGISVFKIYMDELDVLPTDKALHVYTKASARLRQVIGEEKNQIVVTTTPEGFKATYKLFKKTPLEDSRLIQASTYDNAANLPSDYILDLKAQYPSNLIDAYIDGQFVNLTSGSVYLFERKIHFSHWVPKPREPMLWGADFNVYKMCFTGHIKRDGIIVAVAEMFNLRDTPDMCEAIMNAYPDRVHYVYPDSSGNNASSKSASQSDLKILKNAGFRVKAKTKNPFIKDRVQAVNKGIEEGRYKVNIKTCPELAEALEQQVYNPTTGQPLKDGDLDNKLDGLGYLMNYLYPIQKPVINQRQLGGM